MDQMVEMVEMAVDTTSDSGDLLRARFSRTICYRLAEREGFSV